MSSPEIVQPRGNSCNYCALCAGCAACILCPVTELAGSVAVNGSAGVTKVTD